MNIAPVSNGTNTKNSSYNENNEIKLLEKQKMQLQDQIRKVNESKLDDKTKQERIKSLQDQIQQIDMEIQQKRSEKLNENKSFNQDAMSSQSNFDKNENSNNLASMDQLVNASATYTKAKVMNNIKNGLNGKSNVLKIEIKLDEGRTGGNPSPKKAELKEIESKEQKLDKKIGETIKTTQNQVKEASDIESENNDENIQDALSIKNDKKENSQLQGSKGIDKKNLKIDIRA